MMTYEQAHEAMRLANSSNRAHWVMDLHPQMRHSDWLRVLGEEWMEMDTLSELRKPLKKALGCKGPLPEMMTPDEQLRYDSLPTEVTVYRGCNLFDKKAGGMYGMSWSLNLEVARAFPLINRYIAMYPVVYRAKVKKNRILAVKLGRDEEEVITFGGYKDHEYMRVPRHPQLSVESVLEGWETGTYYERIVEWGHGFHTTFVPVLT
jgi:hypothetical protein